jgi:hypothetical protein
MANKELGKLSVSITPEALRSIIADGRLLELADKIATEASAQISAQLVEQVASEALKPDGLKTGVTANVSFIFEGGDFGTVPPRPKHGVIGLGELSQGALRRLAAPQASGGS